ncbi:T9SS type A sorting domain-containing protein [Paracnuella aquatica]|uniref:T9SS type A sorting domain-containing protein n=1 Tax=Paracnuella aquatica TaxID=2268757 RepID=UPI000DEFCBEC|nr:T9SS type A sorting domain-containing protein [Paracnuella aquatica]RPD50594.1 T9SS C-terminal target domain-containing protein [Paracnuella aquatica]
MKKILRSFKTQFYVLLILVGLLSTVQMASAATYYLTSNSNPSTLNNWNTKLDGSGSTPLNFITNGDIFIIPSNRTTSFSNNSNWTLGSNVTLRVEGTLAVGGNNSDVFINGTVEFLKTTGNQVTLSGGGNGTDFVLGESGTLRTANSNGISCPSCSLPLSATNKAITLPTTANFEFFGATQATAGLPSTVNNLTIRSTGIVTLAENADVNGTLEIVSGTLNSSNKSINVAGNWIKNGGAFNGGTATVTFDGSTLQTISGTSLTTFNSIDISNASGVAFAQSGSTSGLTLTNGKLFIRPGFTLTKNTPTAVGGSPFGAAKHIVTEVNTTTGVEGIFQVNGITSPFLAPIGNGTYYLPATVDPITATDFRFVVFAPLTFNGQPNGSLASADDLRNLVNVVWKIDRLNNNAELYKMELRWPGTAVEGSNFQGATQIGVRRFNAPGELSETDDDAAYSNANTTEGNFATLETEQVGSFTIGLAGGNIALPVRFAHVKATRKAAGVDIAFANLTEEEVAVYHVERSTNGYQFQSIGTIAPKANNNSHVDYLFNDAAPAAGDNYYRIRAVETTGKQVYSSVVKVGVSGAAASLVLYPNPASKASGINLQLANLPAGVYSIRLYNGNGQVMATKQLQHTGGSLSEALPLQGAGAGRYIVEVKGAVQFTQSFLLQ